VKLGDHTVAGAGGAVHSDDGVDLAVAVEEGAPAHHDAAAADAVDDALLGQDGGRRVEREAVVGGEGGRHGAGDQISLVAASEVVGGDAVETGEALVDEQVTAVHVEDRGRVAIVVDRRRRREDGQLGGELACLHAGHL
jgi:hypothetical protein